MNYRVYHARCCPDQAVVQRAMEFVRPMKVRIGTLGHRCIDSSPKLQQNTILIADDAEVLAYHKTDQSVRFRAISGAVLESGGHVWLLTARPRFEEPERLWSMLEAAELGRRAFGSWSSMCYLYGSRRPRTQEIVECLSGVVFHQSRAAVAKKASDIDRGLANIARRMALQPPEITAIEAKIIGHLPASPRLDLGPDDPEAAASRISAARKDLRRARPRKPIMPPRYRVDDPHRRPAKNAREEWAQRALTTLAAADPDYASELNAVGFNQADTHEGYRLAVLVDSGGLNDADWSKTVRMCRKYEEQVEAAKRTRFDEIE